jgi:hypothetical protein
MMQFSFRQLLAAFPLVAASIRLPAYPFPSSTSRQNRGIPSYAAM